MKTKFALLALLGLFLIGPYNVYPQEEESYETEEYMEDYDTYEDDEITEEGEPTRNSYQVILNNLFDDSGSADIENSRR